MTGFINPLHYVFDQQQMLKDRFILAHAIPFQSTAANLLHEAESDPETPVEFGHSLEDLIGGQLAAGFQLIDFFEDSWGGSDALSKFIATFAATLVEKPASTPRVPITT